MAPAKCLENIVILCFEWRLSKQSSVNHLKSNILDPPKIHPPHFWAGYATAHAHKLAAHENKLDVKLQSLCGSVFSMFAVSVLAKPYHLGVNYMTKNTLRKQRWGTFLYRQV